MASNSLLSGQPRGTVSRRPGRALGAVLGHLLAFALSCVVFVWTPGGQWLDGWLVPRAERGGGYEQRGMPVQTAHAVLSIFGEPVLLGALLLVIVLVGAVRGRWWAGVSGVAGVLAALAVAQVLKQVIRRPDFGVPGSTEHNSFPSGHVTVATSLVLALLLVVPARVRWWLALPATLAVSVISCATMIAGWHRFSDTLGGMLLAAVLCGLAAVALPPDPVSHVDNLRWLAILVLAAPVLTALAAVASGAAQGLFTGMVVASECAALTVGSVLLVRCADPRTEGVRGLE